MVLPLSCLLVEQVHFRLTPPNIPGKLYQFFQSSPGLLRELLRAVTQSKKPVFAVWVVPLLLNLKDVLVAGTAVKERVRSQGVKKFLWILRALASVRRYPPSGHVTLIVIVC